MSYISRAVSTNDTCGRREDDQERHDGEQTDDFGQNQIAGRIDAHNLESVDLLGNTHGAQLWGDVGTHFSCQD